MKKIILGLLKGYKKFVSPLLPRSCRFYPTCADYARDAVMKYGVIKGVFMGARRVLRCNPFCRGGYDPVV